MTQNDDPKPDAIIFVPGLTGAAIDQSVEGFARRLARALDISNPDISVRVEAGSHASDLSIGGGEPGGIQVRTATVSRPGDPASGAQPLFDVYKFDYSELLVRSFTNAGLPGKVWMLVRTIASCLFHFPVLRKSAKEGKEKLQLLFGFSVFFFIFGYWLSLGAALVETVNGSFREQTHAQHASEHPTPHQRAESQPQVPIPEVSQLTADTPAAEPEPGGSAKAGYPPWIGQVAIFLALFVAAVELFYPDWRLVLRLACTEYSTLVMYLIQGERRLQLTGQFTELVEHILESGKYGQVHVVSYSFGTILSLDALFPVQSDPPRHFSDISTLITIACPFDTIRTFFPFYFEKRRLAESVQPKWVNIYAPSDILSSNFRNDAEVGDRAPSQTGILGVATGDANAEPVASRVPLNECFPFDGNLEPPGLKSAVTFGGFRAHTKYWGPVFEGDSQCFSLVVKHLDT